MALNLVQRMAMVMYWRSQFPFYNFEYNQITMRLSEVLLWKQPELDLMNSENVTDAVLEFIFGDAVNVVNDEYRRILARAFFYRFRKKQIAGETVSDFLLNVRDVLYSKGPFINECFSVLNNNPLFTTSRVVKRQGEISRIGTDAGSVKSEDVSGTTSESAGSEGHESDDHGSSSATNKRNGAEVGNRAGEGSKIEDVESVADKSEQGENHEAETDTKGSNGSNAKYVSETGDSEETTRSETVNTLTDGSETPGVTEFTLKGAQKVTETPEDRYSETEFIDRVSWHLEQDTPQNGLSDVENMTYLSRANKDIQMGSEKKKEYGSMSTLTVFGADDPDYKGDKVFREGSDSYHKDVMVKHHPGVISENGYDSNDGRNAKNSNAIHNESGNQNQDEAAINEKSRRDLRSADENRKDGSVSASSEVESSNRQSAENGEEARQQVNNGKATGINQSAGASTGINVGSVETANVKSEQEDHGEEVVEVFLDFDKIAGNQPDLFDVILSKFAGLFIQWE